MFCLEKMIARSSQKDDVDAAESYRANYARRLRDHFGNEYAPQQIHDRASQGNDPKSCNCANECVCAVVGHFISSHNKALEESVGTKVVCRGFSRAWYDKEVRDLVQRRREAYSEFSRSHRDCDWRRFCNLRTACHKLIQEKEQNHWERTLDSLEQAYKGDHKRMWTMIRKMIPASDKVSVTPIKNQDGTTAHSEEEILEGWAAHQEALGTPQDNPQWNKVFAREIEAKLDAINSEEGGDLDHDFDSLEVQEAVDALNYHKAAAEDGTKNPMHQCGGEFMVELLVKLFNFLKMKEMTPENWSRSVVVNLYKDGDRTDPSNYRGIALISCLGKLYLSLWARRITNYMESRLSEEQGGFRPRRSTVEKNRLSPFARPFCTGTGKVFLPTCTSSTSRRRSTQFGLTGYGPVCTKRASEAKPSES